MTPDLRPFHLALPVSDLAAAEGFYCGLLGCIKGRVATRWIDINFYGHQLTLHRVDAEGNAPPTSLVDGDDVPTRHFGIVLEWQSWQDLADRLAAQKCEFLLAPHVRFEGEVGEQATLFVADPSGNALEFKSFADPEQLFAV